MSTKTLITTFLLATNALGQPPDSLWSRTYGGNNIDVCRAFQQTTDGGYILAGSTMSFGGYRTFWLVKTNSNGDSLWSRMFGGSDSDECYSVQQTSDGGYILAGYTSSFGIEPIDIWLVKTDTNGDSLWSRTFGGENVDGCHSIQLTTDGGYILAGSANFNSGSSDFWLLKVDSNGDSLWGHTYDGIDGDICNSVQQTNDGGYILAGYTNSHDIVTGDGWLLKTDSDGDSLWSQTFGGFNNNRFYSVKQTNDGGYIIAGETVGNFWLMKTNENGDSLWSRTFGGNMYDGASCVLTLVDGNYILSGYTLNNSSGSADYWIIKVNENGNIIWNRTFGGDNSDYCTASQATLDGGFALAGLTRSFGAGNEDFWLLKTTPDPTNTENQFLPFPNSFEILSAYPNPFNGSVRVALNIPFQSQAKIVVHDVLGHTVHEDQISNQNSNQVSWIWNPEAQASGNYFISLLPQSYNSTFSPPTVRVTLLK